MRTKFLRTFAVFVFAAALISISGCKKKAEKESENLLIPEETDGAILKKMTDEQKEFFADKKICVVFGYNYNDADFIEQTKKTLNTLYGFLDEDENPKNLVFTVTYPDDFAIAGKIRNSHLLDLIDDNLENGESLAGILVLGAPDGLHAVLARLEDKAEKTNVKFPIFSYFSQDDILGTEANSDIVLEFAPKAAFIPIEGDDENSGMTESEAPKEDIEHLITGTIDKFIELQGSCPKKDGADLKKIVEEIDKKAHKVKNYSDSESGLLSKNHFVLD